MSTAALNAVENKISNVNDLVKKADYDAKTPDIEKRYILLLLIIILLKMIYLMQRQKKKS